MATLHSRNISLAQIYCSLVSSVLAILLYDCSTFSSGIPASTRVFAINRRDATRAQFPVHPVKFLVSSPKAKLVSSERESHLKFASPSEKSWLPRAPTANSVSIKFTSPPSCEIRDSLSIRRYHEFGKRSSNFVSAWKKRVVEFLSI